MNFVDIVVLAVIALSTLLALGRGFVKEVLSIFGWIGAAIGTFLIFVYVPAVKEFARKQITEPVLADIACAVALFVVLLIARCSEDRCDEIRSTFGPASAEYQQCLARQRTSSGSGAYGGSWGSGGGGGGGHK